MYEKLFCSSKSHVSVQLFTAKFCFYPLLVGKNEYFSKYSDWLTNKPTVTYVLFTFVLRLFAQGNLQSVSFGITEGRGINTASKHFEQWDTRTVKYHNNTFGLYGNFFFQGAWLTR